MRTKFFFYCLLIALIFSGAIYSQPKPPSVREKLKQLKKSLELSETQAKQIETILKTTEVKMDSLREKMEDERDNAMDAMDSIIEAEDVEIVKVLDESQKEKYVEMKKEMEENRPQKGERPEPPGDKR
jgi:F0F1-type ATP synthase membrane subunit b/b'